MAGAERFVIEVGDAQIADLRARLEGVRWPHEAAGNDAWEWGTNLGYMRRLVGHWLDGFDWRAVEASLNRFEHFRAAITAETGEVHQIHYILERGSGRRPAPLLLTHGWPSTFVEFSDVIERLAHPERFGGDADEGFDVVVPSCPGFGFSSLPMQPVAPRAMAHLWDALMREVLGYPRYIAHGGDLGAFITSQLGLHHADSLYGVHLTMLPLVFRLNDGVQAPVTEEEQAYLDARSRRGRDGGGYSAIQSTKPMALAYGLSDSPVGLLAWIADKWFAWSDFDRGQSSAAFEARVPMDLLLTTASIYWFTATISSANNMYKAGQIERSGGLKPGQRVEAPVGYTEYPQDLDGVVPAMPRSWGERGHRIVHYEVMPRGGHFPALTEPELFADDLRRFASKVRSE